MSIINIIKEWLKYWFFEQGAVYEGQDNRYGLFHFGTIAVCILLIVGIWLFVKFSKNKQQTSKIIIILLVSLICGFEILQRFGYFVRLYYFKDPDVWYMNPLWIMLPKPWCAIACWALMAAPIVNKKFFYNYASTTAFLCSLMFFISPPVGYNYVTLYFGNYYSIITHSLLLITSISLITLKFTEFKYKDIWKVAICFVATYIYGLIEIYVFKFVGHLDPMYFMPNGDIQVGILGIPYGLYIVLYIIFIITFVNAFYLFSLIKPRKKILKEPKEPIEISENKKMQVAITRAFTGFFGIDSFMMGNISTGIVRVIFASIMILVLLTGLCLSLFMELPGLICVCMALYIIIFVSIVYFVSGIKMIGKTKEEVAKQY